MANARHAVLFKIQDATLATTKLSKIAGATAAPESAASLRCQNRQRLNPSLSMNPASGRSNWQTANPTDLPNLVKWTKKSPPIQPSGNASARAEPGWHLPVPGGEPTGFRPPAPPFPPLVAMAALVATPQVWRVLRIPSAAQILVPPGEFTRGNFRLPSRAGALRATPQARAAPSGVFFGLRQRPQMNRCCPARGAEPPAASLQMHAIQETAADQKHRSGAGGGFDHVDDFRLHIVDVGTTAQFQHQRVEQGAVVDQERHAAGRNIAELHLNEIVLGRQFAVQNGCNRLSIGVGPARTGSLHARVGRRPPIETLPALQTPESRTSGLALDSRRAIADRAAVARPAPCGHGLPPIRLPVEPGR